MCQAATFFVVAEQRTRTRNHHRLTGNVKQSSAVIRFHILWSPESFIEFICSWISCNWEVSFCIVSWFSLTFCTETSSTRCSCAQLISPISCTFRIWVFGKTFSFIYNSSKSRTCCRLDTTNPLCTSCGALFCSFVRFVNDRCTY